MALTRRAQRFNTAIWPGFVDAMTGLLLVLMFVLTIFMVIQFVLQETISGQEDELNDLSAEIASLASALGLEQERSAILTETINLAAREANAQAALITTLTQERDAQAAALTEAQNRITGFEAQVAGLLAADAANTATIADLEATRDTLLTEQEALNLALATARDEIDANAEAARLAAARREALEALVADLEGQAETDAAAISDLEAARLADAAAAQALRDRLANADAELTAMTLALEEQRREAEETLTLLAATTAAREQLATNLAAALLAQQQAEQQLVVAQDDRADIDARLLAAVTLQDQTAADLLAAQQALSEASLSGQDLQAQLAATLAARDTDAASLAALEAQLAEAFLAREALQTQLAGLDENNAEAATTIAALQARLDDSRAENEALKIEMAALTATTDAATDASDVLQARLDASLAEAERLREQVATLSLTSTESDRANLDLQARLAAALAARDTQSTEAERQAALLAAANQALSSEQALSADSLRKVEALNLQVSELRRQVSTLQTLLDVANTSDLDSRVQIEQLGAQLNTALARVAAEERRRAELEEAERTRLAEEAARLAAEAESLAAEAQDLARFKSDFFGQLRDILEGQDGVRVEGDRFVFSSEVLFQPAQAELSILGRNEIAKVATILRDVADQIPAGIDWVIRVDGHTDNSPLSGLGRYRDNWELSQARALSVVRYMSEDLGIPPDRLAANGFGEYQPLNPADTDEARAQNRRIELKLTEK